MSNDTDINSTLAGVSNDTSRTVVDTLQRRLTSLLDLQMTLKHVHWNVVGMNFIAIHEMLDPQVDGVRAMSDVLAERIATLGGEPLGTPGSVVSGRTWDDYDVNRAPTVQHLIALDAVYSGITGDHRSAVAEIADLDPVSEDILVTQLGELELFQWFVRAHLKDSSGEVAQQPTYDAR